MAEVKMVKVWSTSMPCVTLMELYLVVMSINACLNQLRSVNVTTATICVLKYMESFQLGSQKILPVR
jgi:hypothetical protein